jgi:hypothetical protein
MRAPLAPDELNALLTRCRREPTLEAIRDLIDRPDPPVQTFLAEPWALPWLERLFDEDAVLQAASPTGLGKSAAVYSASPEASFFAQSLLTAISHHASSTLGPRIARVLTSHPEEAVRIAACRTFERWGNDDHEPWLREAFADSSPNVRRRAMRAVMLRGVDTAYDRIGAKAAAEALDVTRLRDLLHIVGRDANRRFAFERVGFRDTDTRWLALGLSFAKSKNRELRADAEYAIHHAPKEALEEAKARVVTFDGAPSVTGPDR